MTVIYTKRPIIHAITSSWKLLKEPDTFYTNVMALKLLDHLTKFYLGLHTIDAVDIPQAMKTLFSNAEGIPQFINAMESAQKKSTQEKLVIHDEYMHAVAIKSLLQSGEYKMKKQEWSKIQEVQQTWVAWKTTFREAYVVKRRAEDAQKGKEKMFWWFRYIRSCT